MKMNKKDIFNLVVSSITGLAHIFLVVLIFRAYRYFSLYPSLIGSIVGLFICLVILVDIACVIGFLHRDKILKIVTLVMTSLIFITGMFGTYYVGKVNKTVSSVIGTTTSNESKTETIDGVFVINTSEKNSYHDLNSFKNKKIGYIPESEEGVSTVGLALIDKEKIDYAAVTFETYDELIIALSDGKVDAGIFIDGYRGLYSKNADNSGENGSDLTGIISTFTDFYPFSKTIDISSTASNKNISTDPFNILLIGWSRTEIGSKVGLADAIIVASVNPKTYTVSMMSIARDSYVPISCYGGTKDKINSARGTSRACFIKTVEDYTGLSMDFYMEADYEAVVEVVDSIGGITITNPVDFNLDGIDVPAGTYTAGGLQVLQFCRERHHMPNGDFDRQQHQKEVIIAIAEKLIKKADITLFLNAIEAAGDKFSTNLTLNQLTGMFNMILQTKNYTGLKVSKLIDFHQLRLTGYSSWYYNEGMQLPLWIYKIYEGSFNESMTHAKEVLGFVPLASAQNSSFDFNVNHPYIRPQMYSDVFDEKHEDEPMPTYYPNFVGMTYAEAVEWSKANNVSLKFDYIERGTSNYDESQHGLVVSQSLRYGIKCSNGVNTLTIMGDGSSNVVGNLPDFTGQNYKDAVAWIEEAKYRYALRPNRTEEKDLDGQIFKVDVDQDDDGDILKVRYYVYCKNPDDFKDGVCKVSDKVTVENYVGKTLNQAKELSPNLKFTFTETNDGANDTNNGKIKSQNVDAGTIVDKNSSVALVIYKKAVAQEHTHTYSNEWSKDAANHWHAATCEHTDQKSGLAAHIYESGKCTVCGQNEPQTEHTHTFSDSWEYDDTNHWHAATCEHTDQKLGLAGHNFDNGVCECGKTIPVESPASNQQEEDPAGGE